MEESLAKKPLRLTRRSFLKAAALTGAGLAIGCQPRSESALISKEIPPDILTEEELRVAHIRIIQTKNVKLHLRKDVFNFPLFRDAQEGSLDEVVIVLTDNLSWNDTRNLPEDAKLAWDSVNESPEEKYESRLKYYKEKINSSKETSESKKEAQMEIEKVTRNPTEWMKFISSISFAGGMFVKGSNIPGYKWLTGQRAENFLKQHPDFLKKVYLFLGMEQRPPYPKQSYPNPTQIEKGATGLPPTGWNYRFESPLPGFAIRHEISHYETGSGGEVSHEYQTDTLAYNSIVEAWKKFQETGDNSGYPFVFVTKDGVTITKKAKEAPQIDAT